MAESVRVFRGPNDLALFVAADVLSHLGYQNLEKGTAQHLRRPPVTIYRVRLTGKRGYPYAAAVDSCGVEWLISKTRPRLRTHDDGEGYEEESNQTEDLAAFTARWRCCISHLPATIPVKYPDLDAMKYTREEREEATQAMLLLRKQTAKEAQTTGSPIAAAFGSFFDFSVLSAVESGRGPWNLKGVAIP